MHGYRSKVTESYSQTAYSLRFQTAVILWTMLLGDRFPVVHEFASFIQEKAPVKVINRDQWNSFLDFVSTDLSSYDESSACKL